jgi:hypothetical protein
MSDIPKAREILKELLDNEWIADAVKVRLRQALRLMRREAVVREAPRSTNGTISNMQRRMIIRLAQDTKLPQSEIARRVGLGSQAGGRVSEVLHGLR